MGRSYKPKVYIVLWKKEVMKVVAFMQGLFGIGTLLINSKHKVDKAKLAALNILCTHGSFQDFCMQDTLMLLEDPE